MKTLAVDEMENAIAKEFEEYVELTTEEVRNICKEVADDCKMTIQEKSPVDTGRYKKSWNVSETEKTRRGVTYTVHSKNRYRLTHLLEYGHAKRGGGRTKAQPHISKGENLAIKELKEKVGAK